MNTDIHVLSGIRTHDPRVRASENSSCLKPSGHYDRLYNIYLFKNLVYTIRAVVLAEEITLFKFAGRVVEIWLKFLGVFCTNYPINTKCKLLGVDNNKLLL
jgi:hypothetical protein